MIIKYRLINLFLKKRTENEIHNVLMKWNNYYQNLSDHNKKVFRIRTVLFIKTTFFETEKGLELTNEMRILISSSFVQITFGLKQDVLNVFNDIFIAPKPYTFKHIDKTFEGDVNPYIKRINLSWSAVERGFKISNDGINLAVHEFGHCLIIENSRRSYLSRIFNEKELENWKILAKKKIKKIKSKRSRVLREYAGTNLMELFSVSIEEFFERPHNFYNKEPKLYLSLCRLLNQDPRNKRNPKLSKSNFFNYPFSNNRA
ncbi:MAG: zinc-dependent peptidase [Bacteroidota bacterium]